MKIEDIACLMGKSVEEVKQMLQKEDCITVELKERRQKCSKENNLEIVIV